MGRFFNRSEDAPTDAVPDDTIHSAGGDIEKAGETLHEEGEDGPQPPIDVEMEKRVVRKLDRHVVPLVMALYLLAYLDRSNVGLVALPTCTSRYPARGLTMMNRNARIAGMDKDLVLTGDRYDWLLTIFYISYITVSAVQCSRSGLLN
jgi:hypothetical protein